MKGFGEQVFTKLFGLLLPVLPVAGVYYGLAYIILYIPDPVSSFVSFTLGVLVLVIIAYGIVQFVTGRTVLFKLLAEKNGGDDLERVNEHSELYRKIDRYLDDRGQ